MRARSRPEPVFEQTEAPRLSSARTAISADFIVYGLLGMSYTSRLALVHRALPDHPPDC